MSLRKRPTLTPKLLAANRANAQRSTGPRPATREPRWNRGRRSKLGVYVRSMRDTMARLGEDPEAFAQRLKRMIEYHAPVGPTETMLVEDIATLELERRRIDRAQCGLLLHQLEQKEVERIKRAFALREAEPAPSGMETLQLGLRHAPASLAKFNELLGLFERIIEAVRRREYTDTDEAVLKAIYGINPNRRGGGILAWYQDLKALPEPATPEEVEEEKDLHALLLTDLLEEERDVATEAEIFRHEHLELTRTMRNVLLAPTAPQWPVMLRQKNAVDRQIERKLKLLLQLQKERRAQEAAALEMADARAR